MGGGGGGGGGGKGEGGRGRGEGGRGMTVQQGIKDWKTSAEPYYPKHQSHPCSLYTLFSARVVPAPTTKSHN